MRWMNFALAVALTSWFAPLLALRSGDVGLFHALCVPSAVLGMCAAALAIAGYRRGERSTLALGAVGYNLERVACYSWWGQAQGVVLGAVALGLAGAACVLLRPRLASYAERLGAVE